MSWKYWLKVTRLFQADKGVIACYFVQPCFQTASPSGAARRRISGRHSSDVETVTRPTNPTRWEILKELLCNSLWPRPLFLLFSFRETLEGWGVGGSFELFRSKKPPKKTPERAEAPDGNQGVAALARIYPWNPNKHGMANPPRSPTPHQTIHLFILSIKAHYFIKIKASACCAAQSFFKNDFTFCSLAFPSVDWLFRMLWIFNRAPIDTSTP